MTNSSFVVNVTTKDFVKIVLEGSSQRPVLVDFWANWCAPCRALGPILDKIAEDWKGKLLVAKIDTDQEKSLAAQLGIRSLPTVRLFHNGRSVGEFMGAIPESEVQAFLQRHLPRASDSLLRQAESLLTQNRAAQALELIERARASEPDNARVTLIFAKTKLMLGDFAAAQAALDALPMQEHNSEEAKILKARLVFERIAIQAQTPKILEERLANQPNDSEARYQLAALQVINGEYQLALDNLLILLRKDRNYGDDAARRSILLIFDLLGGNGELVNRYRVKLTNALF